MNEQRSQPDQDQLSRWENEIGDQAHKVRKGLAQCWLDLHKAGIISDRTREQVHAALADMRGFLAGIEQQLPARED